MRESLSQKWSQCHPFFRLALWKEKTLLNLWERNCREGMSETESDKDRPIWSVPELRKKCFKSSSKLLTIIFNMHPLYFVSKTKKG